jgi:hypothetical protein
LEKSVLKPSTLFAPYINRQDSKTYAFGKAHTVILADVDKNGFIDIVTFPSNFEYDVPLKPIVWANTAGKFSYGTTTTIPNAGRYEYVRDLVEGDFNGDGILDYFALDQGFELNNRDTSQFKGYHPSMLIGTKTGLTWQTQDKFLSTDAAAKRTFNHIGDTADYDGDGDLDIVVAAFWDYRLYNNDGTGKFTWVQNGISSQHTDASGTTFIKLAGKYAIVNGFYRMHEPGDHKDPPVVLTQQNGRFVESYFLSKPNLGGREQNYGAADMYNQDLNGDGLEDLVIVWETEPRNGIDDGQSLMNGGGQDKRYKDLSNNIATVFLQNKDGKLVDTKQVLSLSGVGAGTFYFQDMNGDGNIDFWHSTYAIHPTKFDEMVWINDGTGRFAHPKEKLFETTEKFKDWYTVSPFFFDVNNDGSIDVVTIRGVFETDYNVRTVGEEVRVFLNEAKPVVNTVAATTPAVTTTPTTTTPTVTVTTAVTKTPDPVAVAAATAAKTETKNDDQVVRLYDAVFDSAPDTGGLNWWTSKMGQGMDLSTVASNFIGSPEFRTLYGTNPNNEQFVTLLYNNVLDRDPDSSGMDWWTDQLDAGTYTRTSALLGFSESPENIRKFELMIVGVDSAIPGGG